MADEVVRRVDDVKKSVNDHRAYRGLELKNGLTALLVSDPETDQSAASMLVGVGECVAFELFVFFFFLCRTNFVSKRLSKTKCLNFKNDLKKKPKMPV